MVNLEKFRQLGMTSIVLIDLQKERIQIKQCTNILQASFYRITLTNHICQTESC